MRLLLIAMLCLIALPVDGCAGKRFEELKERADYVVYLRTELGQPQFEAFLIEGREQVAAIVEAIQADSRTPDPWPGDIDGRCATDIILFVNSGEQRVIREFRILRRGILVLNGEDHSSAHTMRALRAAKSRRLSSQEIVEKTFDPGYRPELIE